jgi:hypothetical protein
VLRAPVKPEAFRLALWIKRQGFHNLSEKLVVQIEKLVLVGHFVDQHIAAHPVRETALVLEARLRGTLDSGSPLHRPICACFLPRLPLYACFFPRLSSSSSQGMQGGNGKKQEMRKYKVCGRK